MCEILADLTRLKKKTIQLGFDEIEGFDLTHLIWMPETLTLTSNTFNWWVSLLATQAMNFIIAPYEFCGRGPRERWAFWAQINVGYEIGEAVFSASQYAGGWSYELSFHGLSGRVNDRLRASVLEGRADHVLYDRVSGSPRPHRTMDGRPITTFSLLVPTREHHTLVMIDESQLTD